MLDGIKKEERNEWLRSRVTQTFLNELEERMIDSIQDMRDDSKLQDQTQMIRTVGFHDGKLTAYEEIIGELKIEREEDSEGESSW